jgi:predicted nuclease of predicted toxin-antitoxin system
VKLLVDQMWPAVLAEQLRRRGHDVIAVLEREDLLHTEDDAVFEAARRDGRAVFTENVGDYVPLATDSLGRGEDHCGLLLTSNSSFPRGHPRTLGRAVRALDRYMAEHSESDALRNQTDWLPAARRGDPHAA